MVLVLVCDIDRWIGGYLRLWLWVTLSWIRALLNPPIEFLLTLNNSNLLFYMHIAVLPWVPKVIIFCFCIHHKFVCYSF